MYYSSPLSSAMRAMGRRNRALGACEYLFGQKHIMYAKSEK